VLAIEWPNPLAPTSIAIGAVIGGWVGETIALVCGYDADKTIRIAMKGSYYGTTLALVGYLVANLAKAIFYAS
jgi:hypothetical protein